MHTDECALLSTRCWVGSWLLLKPAEVLWSHNKAPSLLP